MRSGEIDTSEDPRNGRVVVRPLPSILTLKEVSKELRCSKAHLSHIINGKVQGVPTLTVARIGRRVLVRREVLLAWLSTVEGQNAKMVADLNPSL